MNIRRFSPRFTLSLCFQSAERDLRQSREKDERELDREIDALYHSSNMAGVIQAVRMGIDRLETVFRADGGVAKRREVEQIKQYIRENYSDSGMGVDQLAREVGMTPNYLSSIFKKIQEKT